MIPFVVLLLATLCFAGKAPARFDLRTGYTPKHWKLIPRTVEVSPDQLLPPLGITPDDFFAFIPPYVGSVIPGKPFTWESPCFKSNTATLTVSGNTSMTLTITTSGQKSWFCDDGYLIGYVASFDIRYIVQDFTDHKITFDGGWTDAELFDINTRGLRFFRFPDGIAATAEEMIETVMMFFGAMIGAHVPEWTAEDNLKFLKDHMGVTMAERPIQRVNISKSEVKSGDFLGIIRLDGLDPMLAWAMGSHTGHTAITMWVNGELYVMESTIKQSYWPTNGIQMTPWDKWLDQAQNANFNVIHLPLSPKVAAKFNVPAALAFFKSVEGLPYGFHNQFTGWIDTKEDNFPGNLTSQLAELLMPFGDWLLSKELGEGQTFDFLRQGLNKRLNTEGLTLVETYMEAQKRGMTLMELVTMPELDAWSFHNTPPMRDGPSMVCDVFVMRMWKAGGIFGNITNSIQAAEFTNWDAYSLNIFDGNYKRPQICVDADPTSQFCQLLGKYRMSLPDYNTVEAYPNMRERCPSKPPKYIKPVGC